MGEIYFYVCLSAGFEGNLVVVLVLEFFELEID